jgi:L-alanine-DL-glutamate epimerase-like enolase superfamily enzyme
MKRRVSNHIESWASLTPFRIANHVWNDYPSVVCQIEQDGMIGWGEALGIYYLDETEQSMLKELESITAELACGANRHDLLELLPPGGARNAADAALWDLEAQLDDTTVWQLAGVAANPVETMFTIGLEAEPDDQATGAAAASDVSLLKIKLNNDRPVERIAAIRAARPDARLVVDANQGWNF